MNYSVHLRLKIQRVLITLAIRAKHTRLRLLDLTKQRDYWSKLNPKDFVKNLNIYLWSMHFALGLYSKKQRKKNWSNFPYEWIVIIIIIISLSSVPNEYSTECTSIKSYYTRRTVRKTNSAAGLKTFQLCLQLNSSRVNHVNRYGQVVQFRN